MQLTYHLCGTPTGALKERYDGFSAAKEYALKNSKGEELRLPDCLQERLMT